MEKERAVQKVWDVAVIGGGPAGLAAAALAARAGASVILLEKGEAPGGRAASSRVDGAVWNLGPHAFIRGGAAQSVLQELGIPLSGHSPTANIHWVPDRNRGEVVSTGTLLIGRTMNWKEKRQFLRFFLGIRKTDARRAAGKSWAEWMSENGLTGRAFDVGAALGRVSTYVGDASRLDAALGVLQIQRPGVLYQDGGWQSIVDGFAVRAAEAGAQIRTGASVTAAQPEKHGTGGWTLRLANGETVQTAKTIAAVDPHRAAALFEPWLPATYKASLQKLEPVYASTLDLHLRRLPNPKRTFALGLDQPLYFSVHSQWSKLCDDPEHAVVHVMRYDGVKKDGDPAKVRMELEDLMDRLQPGWRDEVVRERYMPRLTVMHAMPSAEGGGTNARPPVDAGLPGVYAAGDWTGPEGILLDASLASAREAALLAVGQQPNGVMVS